MEELLSNIHNRLKNTKESLWAITPGETKEIYARLVALTDDAKKERTRELLQKAFCLNEKDAIIFRGDTIYVKRFVGGENTAQEINAVLASAFGSIETAKDEFMSLCVVFINTKLDWNTLTAIGIGRTLLDMLKQTAMESLELRIADVAERQSVCMVWIKKFWLLAYQEVAKKLIVKSIEKNSPTADILSKLGTITDDKGFIWTLSLLQALGAQIAKHEEKIHSKDSYMENIRARIAEIEESALPVREEIERLDAALKEQEANIQEDSDIVAKIKKEINEARLENRASEVVEKSMNIKELELGIIKTLDAMQLMENSKKGLLVKLSRLVGEKNIAAKKIADEEAKIASVVLAFKDWEMKFFKAATAVAMSIAQKKD